MFSEPFRCFSSIEIYEPLFKVWIGGARTHDRRIMRTPAPVHRAHYLHGYHGVVPLIALIAPFAQVARSTNRSTTAAPDPLVPLLYVTSQAGPGLHRRERGPVRQEPGDHKRVH